MFACLVSHRSAEPDTLVVYIHLDQRDELLRDALKDLLLGAWAIVASKIKRSSKTTARFTRRKPRRELCPRIEHDLKQ